MSDVNALKVGNKVIIASNNYSVALSTTQNNNNRGQANVSIVGENVVNIKFKEPVSSITPGQACVLYNLAEGFLLGGGFISI